MKLAIIINRSELNEVKQFAKKLIGSKEIDVRATNYGGQLCIVININNCDYVTVIECESVFELIETIKL